MSVFAKGKSESGFTLVELAIVLVIIGIILGAVVKGQDLIINSRAKKLAATVSNWSSLGFAYMDRMGRLPGDSGRNGIIGDALTAAPAEQVGVTTAIGELSNPGVVSSMSTAPLNPVILGGQSFWVYFGYDTIGGNKKNVIVICKDSACASTLTSDEAQIMQAVDTAIDGQADAGIGQFRAVTGTPTLAGVATLTAAQGGRATAAITAVTAINTTAAGATAQWALTHQAAVWHFDKPF